MSLRKIILCSTQEEHDKITMDKMQEAIEHNFARHLELGDECCQEWFFELAHQVYDKFEKSTQIEDLRRRAISERIKQRQARTKT